MFSPRYFAPRYFAVRYFPPGGIELGLIIDGTIRTPLLKVNTLGFSNRLNGRQSLTFKLILKGPPPYIGIPTAGETVEVINETEIVFSGKIFSVDEIEVIKSSGMVVQCDCVDHTAIFDRFTAIRILDQQTAGEMVKTLVSEFIPEQEGINTDDVQTGLTIDRAVFGYKRMSNAISELSRVSGFMWFVDNNKRLQFFDRTSFAAPFSLSDGSKNYRKITVKKRLDQYINKQFIRAGEDTTDERTETFTGDTERRTFTTSFKVAEKPTITLNAGPQTVGTRGIDSEADFDWLFQKGEKEIAQGSGGTTLDATDTLSVKYKGLFPIVVLDEDSSEIAARSAIEGGSGIYESVEDDDSIESRAFALQKASGILRRFAKVPVIVKFETDTNGLKAGQLLNINIPNLNLLGDFLIDEVKARDMNAVLLRYTVTALSGEHLGSWFEFFRTLQEAGRTLSLNETETLGLIRKLTETIKLTETFNTIDALAAASADTRSCWTWGFATWGKSPWCTLE